MTDSSYTRIKRLHLKTPGWSYTADADFRSVFETLPKRMYSDQVDAANADV